MPDLSVEHVEKFGPGVLVELCSITVDAIVNGIGFGWVRPPSRQHLESYWKGVVLVPERELYIGLVDGSVAGSVQLVKPASHFEAVHFTTHIDTHFVAPWARGHGLARLLLEAASGGSRGAVKFLSDGWQQGAWQPSFSCNIEAVDYCWEHNDEQDRL